MRGSMDGLDGFFDEFENLGQNIIDGIKQDAIGGGTALLLGQPAVQAALKQTAQEKAAQSLADKILSTGKSAAELVQQNQQTIQLLSVALGLTVVYFMFFKRSRA